MKRDFLHILHCNNMESVNWRNSCSSMLTERRATQQNLLGNQENIEFLAEESEGRGRGGWGGGGQNTIN